jgi:hypothetical protein
LEDGWCPAPLRQGDVNLYQEIMAAELRGAVDSTTAHVLRNGVEECDVQWLSQLCDAEGCRAFPWQEVGGWSWVADLAPVLHLEKLGVGWNLPAHHRLGQWRNELVQGADSIVQAVWGEGLCVGSVVERAGRVGILRTLSRGGQGATGSVEWLEGSFCLQETRCKYCRGKGDRKFWIEDPNNRWSDGCNPRAPWEEVTVSDLTVRAGNEVRRSGGRRRAVVLWDDTPRAGAVKPEGALQGSWTGLDWQISPGPISATGAVESDEPSSNDEETSDGEREEAAEVNGRGGASLRQQPAEMAALFDRPASRTAYGGGVGSETSEEDWDRWLEEAEGDGSAVVPDRMARASEAHPGDRGNAEPADLCGGGSCDATGGIDSCEDVEGRLLDQMVGGSTEWNGAEVEVWHRVERGWAEGKSLIATTDGGYRRDIRQAAAQPGRAWQGMWELAERGSCGWVMGIGASVGDDGSESNNASWDARGGGGLLGCSGAKSSSYRSELFGMVMLLRVLCRNAARGGVAGPVAHWTDNESIVRVLSCSNTMRRDKWRRLQSRDLWAEIRGRIQWWEGRGGRWCTKWVKGHVDSDMSRAEHTWSGAERQNMMADALATSQLVSPTSECAPDPTDWPPKEGVWTSSGANPTLGVQWWDDIRALFGKHATDTAGHRYWQAREARRNKATPAGQPAIDTRLARSSDAKRGRSRWDIFRCKLWWDHLPSQAVRNRGSQTNAGGAANRCDHCLRECAGTTWHILAECTHDALVTARAAGRVRILQALDDIEKGEPPTAATRVWREAFREEDGCWVPPPDWTDEMTKAGEAFNPWYGLFPPAWLDNRWREKGEEYRHWTSTVSEIRKVGQVALEACHGVWTAAARLWGERARQPRPGTTGLSRTDHIVAAMIRRWATVPPRPATDFLFQQTLQAADSALTAKAMTLNKIRGRRHTAHEATLLRWSEWPAQERVLWYRTARESLVVSNRARRLWQATRRKTKRQRRQLQSAMLRATCTLRDFDKQGAGAGGDGYGEGGGAPGEAHPGADRITRAALTQDIAYGAGGGSGRSDIAEGAARGTMAPRAQGQKRTRKEEEGKRLHTGSRKRLQQQDIRRFGGGGRADNPESGRQRCEACQSAAGTSARPSTTHIQGDAALIRQGRFLTPRGCKRQRADAGTLKQLSGHQRCEARKCAAGNSERSNTTHSKGDAALTRQGGGSTPRGCKRQRADAGTLEHEECEDNGTEPRKKAPRVGGNGTGAAGSSSGSTARWEGAGRTRRARETRTSWKDTFS